MRSVIPVSTLKHLLILITGFTLWSAASADDVVVYESLPDVTIGRVFFSPEQRQRLDQRRHRKTTTKDRRNLAPAGRTRVNVAAGYILSSSGKLRIYANGDFVAGKRQEPMHFPGDVSISRQDSGSEEEAVQSQSATESSDEDD